MGAEFVYQPSFKGFDVASFAYYKVRHPEGPLPDANFYKDLPNRKQYSLPRPVGLTGIPEQPQYSAHDTLTKLSALGAPQKILSKLGPHLSRHETDHIIEQPVNFPHSEFHRDQGILKIKDHEWGSAAIALRFLGSKKVAETILAHTNYRRPETMPIEGQILVMADRLAGMGYTEVIRLAWTMGFRDEALSLSTLRNQNIVDKRIPPETRTVKRRKIHMMSAYDLFAEYDIDETDYEQTVREYCLKSVMPWLKNKDLHNKVAEQLRKNQNYVEQKLTHMQSIVHRPDDRFRLESRDGIGSVPLVYDLLQLKYYVNAEAYNDLTA